MDRKLTDDELRDWQSIEGDIGDLLMRHFSASQLKDWIDVTNEGRRIYSVTFGDEVEQFSLLDSIFSAIAAESMHSAYRAVAQAIGVETDDLEGAVCEWEEGSRSDAVGIEGLLPLIEDHKRVRLELNDADNSDSR